MSDGLIALLKRLQGDRSQEEFAALLGVSQSAVSRYYSGKRQPTREVWSAAARAFPEHRDEITALFLSLDHDNGHEHLPIGKSEDPAA